MLTCLAVGGITAEDIPIPVHNHYLPPLLNLLLLREVTKEAGTDLAIRRDLNPMIISSTF